MSSSDNSGMLIGLQFILIVGLAGYVFYRFSECGCYNELKEAEINRAQMGGNNMLHVPPIDPDEYKRITEDDYTAQPPRDPIAFGKQELRVYIDDEYLPKAIEGFTENPGPFGPPFDITLHAEAHAI